MNPYVIKQSTIAVAYPLRISADELAKKGASQGRQAFWMHIQGRHSPLSTVDISNSELARFNTNSKQYCTLGMITRTVQQAQQLR